MQLTESLEQSNPGMTIYITFLHPKIWALYKSNKVPCTASLLAKYKTSTFLKDASQALAVDCSWHC